MQNGFGFYDENDDTDTVTPVETSHSPVLPAAINASVGPFKKFTGQTSSPKVRVPSPKKPSDVAASNETTKTLFRKPKAAINNLRETVQRMKNHCSSTVASNVLGDPKSKTQTKITELFGDQNIGAASKPSSSKRPKVVPARKKIDVRTKLTVESDTTSTYLGNEASSLFETTWPEREDVSVK